MSWIAVGIGGVGLISGYSAYSNSKNQANKDKNLSQLFGRKYEGIKPYSSLNDVPTGTKLRSTIEDRLAGIGVGYDPEVLNASTAPYAKAEREQFQNYTVPTISQQASARGLGRSTIPVNQIKQGAGELENRIGERVANLTLANEQQKRSEINDALARYQQYTNDDVRTREIAAKFNYAEWLDERAAEAGSIELAAQAQQTRDQANTQLIQAGIGAVGGFTGGFAGGLLSLSGGIQSFQNSYSGMNQNQLMNYMQMLQQPNASVVNKGYGNWGGGSWSGG